MMAVCANCEHNDHAHRGNRGCIVLAPGTTNKCDCLWEFDRALNQMVLPDPHPNSWRGIPMATVCADCGHVANMHSDDRSCLVCICRAFALPVSDCGARMHSADGPACDGLHNDDGHHGMDVGGDNRVHWTEAAAVYLDPVTDSAERERTGRAGGLDVRDQQVGGDHYRKLKIQPWDIWEAYNLDAFTGAILKYLLRDKGNRLEDLKKARHTLDKLIEIEEGRSG